MDISEGIRTLRSVRQFTDSLLSDDDTRAILNAGRRAQSSKNSQPWQFVAITNRDTLKSLAGCGTYAGHLEGAALGVALASSETWDFDLGQATAFMQLAAWDRGIGSCIAAMWEQDRAKSILGIPQEMHFRIAISFGYPDTSQQRPVGVQSGRRPLDQIVHKERW